MKLGKIAASALFTASMLTFGVADPVLDATPVAYASSEECQLESYFTMVWHGAPVQGFRPAAVYPGSDEQRIFRGGKEMGRS